MPLLIQIPRLPEEGAAFEGEEEASCLRLTGDRFIEAVVPVRYELFARLVSHELVLNGRLSTVLAMQCARCAEPFTIDLVEEDFLRTLTIPESAEEVDVTDELSEALLLNLPHIPVCDPDCRGLCAQCGQNLNRTSCACEQPPADDRWGGLDKLALE